MEHVEVLRELRDSWVRLDEKPALDAAIAALSAPQPPAEAQPDRMAIKLLVAAGFVTEAKANEALNIAHGFDKGPLEPAEAQPVGDEKVLWGVVANAGRLSPDRQQRWAHVMDATGMGSQSSIALCERFGRDPDEVVGGHADEDRSPPSAPLGVEGLLERWRKESRRLYAKHLKSMALRPLGQSDAYDACRAELSALAQKPAPTLPDVDDDLTAAYMLGKYDGRKQPAAVDGAMVWKPINVLPASDDLFWFARGDTVDGPRPPQYVGYDAEEWDWFAPAEAPPFSAEMDALAAQQGGVE